MMLNDAAANTTIADLSRRLAELADELDIRTAWPAEGLRLCQDAGVMRWCAPREQHGFGWSEAEVLEGYLQLAQGCLSTTFVITQPHGVIRRLLDSDNEELREQVLPLLLSGEAFASVGISQLTTSRRHAAKPVMQLRETGGGIQLDGLCPWVTGGVHSDYIVTGGVFDNGQQALVLLPTDRPGVSFDPPAEMVGLSSTQTGAMRCRQVLIEKHWILAGPSDNVMASRKGANTGGLQTSALAIGLGQAAVEYLRREAVQRADLGPAVTALDEELQALRRDLLATADGRATFTSDAIRSRANSFVLRSTQAALTAAKGTGYLRGHAVGRWCREALFFLVWSCPQPVASATLCELAGIV